MPPKKGTKRKAVAASKKDADADADADAATTDGYDCLYVLPLRLLAADAAAAPAIALSGNHNCGRWLRLPVLWFLRVQRMRSAPTYCGYDKGQWQA